MLSAGQCPSTKTMAYNTLVHLIVEYAPTVWDPYTVGEHRQCIESTATKGAGHAGWTNVTGHPWRSIENTNWLSIMYRIRNNVVVIDSTPHLTCLMTISHAQDPIDYHKNSFLTQITVDWNAIPESTIIALNCPPSKHDWQRLKPVV